MLSRTSRAAASCCISAQAYPPPRGLPVWAEAVPGVYFTLNNSNNKRPSWEKQPGAWVKEQKDLQWLGCRTRRGASQRRKWPPGASLATLHAHCSFRDQPRWLMLGRKPRTRRRHYPASVSCHWPPKATKLEKVMVPLNCQSLGSHCTCQPWPMCAPHCFPLHEPLMGHVEAHKCRERHLRALMDERLTAWATLRGVQCSRALRPRPPLSRAAGLEGHGKPCGCDRLTCCDIIVL